MSSKSQVPLVVSRWSNFERAIRRHLGDPDTEYLWKRASDLWDASWLAEGSAADTALIIARVATRKAFEERGRPIEGPLFDAFLHCAHAIVLDDELLYWPRLGNCSPPC